MEEEVGLEGKLVALVLLLGNRLALMFRCAGRPLLCRGIDMRGTPRPHHKHDIAHSQVDTRSAELVFREQRSNRQVAWKCHAPDQLPSAEGADGR